VVCFIRTIPKSAEAVQTLIMRAGIVANVTRADRPRLEAIVPVVRVFGTRSGLNQESLWLLWFVILCGLPTVQQAAIGDCLSFDPFPFDQNGLAPPEVDVGWRQVADALVISHVIVVGDEGRDLGFEIARQ
jgi:hypothetical protein